MSLLPLLARYWGEIEADLQRVYQTDLMGLWTGELTLRRCAVLVHGLPQGGALDKAMGGDRYWSEETAATLTGLWRVESRLSDRKTAPKPPKPPEPGWREKQARQHARAERMTKRYE